MVRIAREQGVGDLGDRELHGATMAEIPQLGQLEGGVRQILPVMGLLIPVPAGLRHSGSPRPNPIRPG
jgi:hypothetical protein